MFSAPWCSMCKKAKPYFEELGKLFEDVPSVMIAQVDATANEVYDNRYKCVAMAAVCVGSYGSSVRSYGSTSCVAMVAVYVS
jgi:protein disulfide-isomerase A1